MLSTLDTIRTCAGALALGLAVAAAPAIADPTPAPASAVDATAETELGEVDRELDEIDALLAAAQFHTALGLTGAARELLAGIASAPGRPAREARLELLSATAEVALGRRARARESLVRALRADPSLWLDEATTSPRIIEVWREARRTMGTSRRSEEGR